MNNNKEVELQNFIPQRSEPPKQVTKDSLLERGLGRPAWATADASAYTTVENNAYKNRRSMTAAEALLWEELKANKLGVHFRRQHVIGMYIADFVSLKNLLVIEVDGDYHQATEQQLLDVERTAYLEKKGFRVIRFTNNQVLTDIESVVSTIIRSLIR
jgi:very-short-patch-repair endonuclease